jgi:hypothetical protein
MFNSKLLSVNSLADKAKNSIGYQVQSNSSDKDVYYWFSLKGYNSTDNDESGDPRFYPVAIVPLQ